MRSQCATLELEISRFESKEVPHGMPAERKSLTGGRPEPMRRSEVVGADGRARRACPDPVHELDILFQETALGMRLSSAASRGLKCER